MGVDITFFAEHRLPDGVWAVVGDLMPNPSYFPDDPDFSDQPQHVPRTLDIPRCSALFAVLANVNNDRTPLPFEVIATPRGIPNDASQLTKTWFDAWGTDALGASWLTIDEIDSFDWNRIWQHYGHVDPTAAYLFEDNPLGFPFDRWPSDLQLSYSESRTDSGNARWRATIGESAGFKWFRQMLTPFESYEMVRFVLWFDH